MAAIDELSGSKKRKRDPSSSSKEKPFKPKFSKKSQTNGLSSKDPKASNSKPVKKEPKTPRELRLASKEMAEERKKKRKPNYSLEKELASLWEKMRCSNVSKEDRSKLISEALRRMNGKFIEIASSHVTARVLQTCVKYCSQAERDVVFEALRPHFLSLSRKKYAVHLVKKLLDNATKRQLEGFISSLHGHVASLLRHTVGSAVVEHAYHLASGSQKQSLLMEMYSTELQLFKDLTLTNSGKLVDVISKLKLQKSSVIQHMTSVIQPLLEKVILDHSIIHTALVEYFTIADKSSAADVILQLSPLLTQESSGIDEGPQSSKKRKNKKRTTVPLLVRMVGTRDGLKVGILCIKHGSAKDRKKIVKGIKEHVRKLALDQYGSLLLTCIFSVVDDTKLVTKIVIRGLQSMLKELVFDRNGRQPLLQLLRPQCTRYLGPDNLACLTLSVPSLCAQAEVEEAIAKEGLERHSELDVEVPMTDNANNEACGKGMQLALGGKKDPSLRRHELLVESGLAENLIETCVENVCELLRSNFGKEVIFEVAIGGTDGVLKSLAEKLDVLHKAIASLASLPRNAINSNEDEHVFENFHSSRTLRKLVQDSPSFAATLWKMALEGKCEMWAQGHSCKVVSAFLESKDSKVRDLAKVELQPLIDRGVLKAPNNEKVGK